MGTIRLLTSPGIRRFSKSNTFRNVLNTRSALGFEMTEEQNNIQETARKFTREEIIPKAAHHDRTGEFPMAIASKAFQVGLMNLNVPEEYGGSGLSCWETTMVGEELAYGCIGIAMAIISSSLAQAPLLQAANEAQKKKYLGRMIEELMFAAYAVTEPTGGSDVAALKTRAEKIGDEYVLNGHKMWISGAGVANWIFVLARTDLDPKAPTSKAFTGFIVEADWPGVIIGRKEPMVGQRASDTRGITFEDVIVPKENVVSVEGKGFQLAMSTFDFTRPLAASFGTGLGQRALDESLKYAMERSTFRNKIINHQAVTFMLADMAIGVENSRLAWMRAAWEVSRGIKNTYSSSIAKVYATECAFKCASNAMQIFGGNGCSQDYAVEKLLRDAKILEIYEGTSQIQRLIIGRELLKQHQRN